MPAVGHHELTLAAEQVHRAVAGIPWGDVVGQARHAIEIAGDLLEIYWSATDLQGAGTGQRVGLVHLDEFAVQRGRQVGGVVVPVEDIECRRLVTEQVVVDPVAPDQVIGAHPGEDFCQLTTFQHTRLIGTALGRLQGFLISEQRDLGVGANIEHADHQGEGIHLALAQCRVVAQKR
ncbi:hypothetical protein D3C80_553030 [compost metagenome]